MGVSYNAEVFVGLPVSKALFVRQETRTSPGCGHDFEVGSRYCPQCGSSTKTEAFEANVWATPELEQAAGTQVEDGDPPWDPDDWAEFIAQDGMETFVPYEERVPEYLGVSLAANGDINYNQGASGPVTPGDIENARDLVISNLAVWGLGHLEAQVAVYMWTSAG